VDWHHKHQTVLKSLHTIAHGHSVTKTASETAVAKRRQYEESLVGR
jgi:hypothetical protein